MHRVSEGLTPEPLPDPDLELAFVVTHERRATLEPALKGRLVHRADVADVHDRCMPVGDPYRVLLVNRRDRFRRQGELAKAGLTEVEPLPVVVGDEHDGRHRERRFSIDATDDVAVLAQHRVPPRRSLHSQRDDTGTVPLEPC